MSGQVGNFVNKGGSTEGANGLPEYVRCKECHLLKPTATDFSKNQMKPYYKSVYNPRPNYNKIQATCKLCTAPQVSELRCSVCEKTKGLPFFSKAQRGQGDRARCIKCVQRHQETEADMTPPSSDEYSSSDYEPADRDFDKKKTKKRSKQRAPPVDDDAVSVASDRTVSVYAESAMGPATPATQKSYAHSRTSSTCGGSPPDVTYGRYWHAVPYAGGDQSKFVAPRRPTPPPHSPVGTSAFDSASEVSDSGSDCDSDSDCRSYAGSDAGTARSRATGSVMSFSSNREAERATVRKGGWAKPEKVAKGKETKWGEAPEEEPEDKKSPKKSPEADKSKGNKHRETAEEVAARVEDRIEWTAYGRRIRDQHAQMDKALYGDEKKRYYYSSSDESDDDEVPTM